jgi:DNA modification methylase
MKAGRNSLGVEIDPHYIDLAEKRLRNEVDQLSQFDVRPTLGVVRG